MKHILTVWLMATSLGTAQSGGRFDDAKRSAVALIQAARFDKASGLLEEIWEQDKHDHFVAEHLGIAYLNGADRKRDPKLADKGVELMEQSIAMGGKATFLVRLSTESLTWLQGRSYADYCTGRLSFTRGRLVFVADPCHKLKLQSFDVQASDVREFQFLSKDARGTVRVKIDDRKYEFAPNSELREDGALMSEFAKKYLVSAR